MLTKSWLAELSRIALLVSVAIALGLLFGHPWVWVSLALLANIGWLLYSARLIDRWLTAPDESQAPPAIGVLGRIAQETDFLRKKSRRRKERLHQVLQEFRQSTSEMPDGGVVLDANFGMVWFNQAAAELLGLQQGEDIGQNIGDLIRHPDFTAYLEQGDFTKPMFVPSPRDDGRTFSCQILSYGSEQSLLLVKDETGRVQLERMRRDFVANASHELRSPLTVIMGYLESLSSDPGQPDELVQPLSEMHRQSQRMSAILTDLLELARLESRRLETDAVTIDVGDILISVRNGIVGHDIADRQIVITKQSDARIRGSEPDIYSALSNLVSNAVKCTSDDSRIEISWTVGASGGDLSVKDTGIGIAAEEIPRLTERFYRVDPGRSREQGGTGLGLAIVKHVMLRHDGALDIQSEPGKGSTFTLRFPADRLVTGPARTKTRLSQN